MYRFPTAHHSFLLLLPRSVPSILNATATSASTATVVLGRPFSAGGLVLYTLTLESQWGSKTTTCPSAGATLDGSVSCEVTTLLAGTTYSVSVTATDRSGVQSAAVTGSFITAPRWVLRLLLALLSACASHTILQPGSLLPVIILSVVCFVPRVSPPCIISRASLTALPTLPPQPPTPPPPHPTHHPPTPRIVHTHLDLLPYFLQHADNS